MWTYNGLVPGPLIRARVGDRVVVHFTNNLPEETTIHWHGLRVPAAMDGMPGHLAAADSARRHLRLRLRRARRVHVLVPPARELGGAGGQRPLRRVHRRRSGRAHRTSATRSSWCSATSASNDDGSLQPADGGGDLGTLFGREGNVLLVNGKVRPTLKARPGLRQRWRIINAAKSRYFQIALDGHPFTRIGGDGGLLTAPVDVAQPVVDARRAHGPARRARRRSRARSWSSNGSPSIAASAAPSTGRPRICSPCSSKARTPRRRPLPHHRSATIAPLPTDGATPDRSHADAAEQRRRSSSASTASRSRTPSR